MKILAFFLLTAVSIASVAHAQLMRLTIESHHLEADFYDYDVAHTDWDSTPYITHYRHPVDGTLFLQDDLDFSNPAHPDLYGIRIWGHAEGIGDFDINFGALSLTQQPSGAIDLGVNTWLEPGPDLNLVWGIRLHPDFTVDPSWGYSFELRNQGDGPGEFHTDSTLWAQPDRITLVPVPEPAVFGPMAGLALLGLIGWHARQRALPRLTLSRPARCSRARVYIDFTAIRPCARGLSLSVYLISARSCTGKYNRPSPSFR